MSPDVATITDTPLHQVALTFEDGVTRFISCRPDQTVADASYRQRINIPLDCRDGACGTCKALCESGEFDGGVYLDDALTADEAERGYVLPCSMKPRSDLVLNIATTSDVAKTTAAQFTATVTGLERLSATTIQLSISIPNRADLVYLPGQYVNVSVPGTDATRSYSFSTGPHEDGLSFLIKITPGGVMSEYLLERAAIGDELTFTGPHGSFFLRDSDRPLLLLAGGTGLAPVLSILRKLQQDASTRPTHLIYGVSTDEDLVAIDQIEAVASGLANFTWDHCVADPRSAARNTGYVTGILHPDHLHGGDAAIYLCGPPPMVEAVRSHVVEAGLEVTGFYYEKFALGSSSDASDADAEDGAVVGTGAEIPAPTLEELILSPEARGIAGRVVLADADIAAWEGPVAPVVPDDTARRIAGRRVAEPGRAIDTADAIETADGVSAGMDEELRLITASDARSIAGRPVFPEESPDSEDPAAEPAPIDLAPSEAAVPIVPVPGTVAPSAAAPTPTAPDGYQIGEEHPDVQSSDALFEAREALELGALELTIGRLTSQQLTGYRLLAELTLPYIEGDRFVDAAAFTETNAAFHDYLFTLTGNEHLLHAYQALGVDGRMADVLKNATWCDPRCAIDHVDLVEAFEREDRAAARELLSAHSLRSKTTMRRAMADAAAASRPRFISPGRFATKVVVVTGAAQGIGAQVARRIAAEDGHLVLVDRSDLVAELAAELTGQGQSAVAVNADLESAHGAAEMVARAVERHGRIDVLVNNVGGAINFKPFTEFTADEIRAEVNRSLMTTLFACHAALPGMVAAGSGVIVNVSSTATRGIHRIPYSASKGGVNALTASLALEYVDHGIRVVATAPGGTAAPARRISRGTPEPRTDREREWFQAHIDQTLGSSPMHRYGTLDEQAAAIAFLASDEASYITGAVLPVGGGDLG